jgi:mRNA-degrading endonuclease RelE of RelBE toxin-antitoxin system
MPAASNVFNIQFTSAAIEDLRWFSKYQQRQILGRIVAQLTQQPGEETRNRKRLRHNALAEWELRVGAFRIFYDVDDEHRQVKVEAVGRKDGNRLYVGGKEYKL